MAEAQIQHDAGAAPGVETRSRRQDFLRTFFSNRLALFGAAVMSVFILMAVFAPLIAPYDPLQQELTEKFAPPMRSPTCSPMTVTVGSMALRRACLKITRHGTTPLALAVRT